MPAWVFAKMESDFFYGPNAAFQGVQEFMVGLVQGQACQRSKGDPPMAMGAFQTHPAGYIPAQMDVAAEREMRIGMPDFSQPTVHRNLQAGFRGQH